VARLLATEDVMAIKSTMFTEDPRISHRCDLLVGQVYGDCFCGGDGSAPLREMPILIFRDHQAEDAGKHRVAFGRGLAVHEDFDLWLRLNANGAGTTLNLRKIEGDAGYLA